MVDLAASVWRDFVTDGVPASGPNKPLKSKIRAWGAYLEAQHIGSGFGFAFSSTTTDADPGAGMFRLNNATIASVTTAYIDNLDATGADVSSILSSWDDSTNTVRGTLTIRGVTNAAVVQVFHVTGSIVDGGGYRKATLTYVGGAGAFVNGDSYALIFTRSGDRGTVNSVTAGGRALVVDNTDPANPIVTGLGPVNVKAFAGVVGDGSNDDTAGIQAALDFVKAQGGGALHFPRGTYKITSGLTYNLSAISSRFASRLRIVGEGSATTSISFVGVAAAALTITGSASFPEMNAHIEGIRLTGSNTVGSKGIVLSISAFGSTDDLIIEGFDYLLDCTDVEQTAFINSNFRWGIHGVRFNAAAGTTSPNSLLFLNCAIANNSIWGVWITNANAVKFEGGSIQYNGATGGGSTQWGCKITEAGNGYGTVAFFGVAFEGNGGDADFISEQSTYVATYKFDACGFTRPNNTNYATNFLKLDGSTASIYNLSGNTLRGYGAYTPNAARPYFAINNASAKVADDGTNVYGSATEQPAWAGAAQFSTSLVPQANDGGALGSATKSWSDAFLASGAVLNFNNGNYTVTHSAGTLTFSGGASWGGALLPSVDGTPSLGSASFRWANTYIAAGGQIIFGTADASITHANGSRIAIGGNLSRQSPVTKTANFAPGALENWIICNGTASITATLPAAASYPGREIMIKTIAAFTVVSASSNVVPLAGGAAGTAILAATAGKWATLVSDGTNWQIMTGN